MHSFIEWLRSLHEAFGFRLLSTLFLSMLVLKGFLGGGGGAGLVGVPVDFLLREFNVKASSLQVYKGSIMIPWSIKPLLGLLADEVPLNGYYRRTYLGLIGIAGLVSYCIIPAFPDLGLTALLCFLFVLILQISWTDLLTEAVYSVRLRESPKAGPDLISFVWGGIAVGKLFSTGIVGPLMESYGTRAPYLLGLPFAALTLLTPVLNLIDEPQKHGSKCCAKRVASDRFLAGIAIATGFGALGLSTLSMLGVSLATKVIAAGCLAVVVLSLFSFVLNPVIAKINAFFFLHNVCSFSIEGASFYFFTDSAEKYPGGPHFSTTFYTSALGLASTVFSLLGMFVYTRWMKSWRYQKVLVVGNVLSSMVQLLSCFVYLRWNLRIGLSDRFFVLASSSLQTVIFELAWLPGMLMISQLCPEGKEATMFALLAGSGNLGMNLGGYFGAFLLHSLGVDPSGAPDETSQFDRLWLAALVAAAAPLIPLAMIRVLVPDVSQQEQIIGSRSATADSALEQMFPSYFASEEAMTSGTDGDKADLELEQMVGQRTAAD